MQCDDTEYNGMKHCSSSTISVRQKYLSMKSAGFRPLRHMMQINY